MAKNNIKRIGLVIAPAKPNVTKRRVGSTKPTREAIRREASSTQHASRASLRPAERSGQPRAGRWTRKK